MAAVTALTTAALAAAAVYAKRMALRVVGGRGRRAARLGAALDLVGAALLLVLGIALVTGNWGAGGGA